MTVTNKLIIITSLICAAYVMLTLLVIYSFKHIEKELITRFSSETRQIIDNANMTRELSRVVSDMNLIIRTFHDNEDGLSADGKQLSDKIHGMIRNTSNTDLRTAIQNLLHHFEDVIYQCGAVNQARNQIREVEKQFDRNLIQLDQIVAERLVDIIVDGGNTLDLEQLSSMIGGWRESFMRLKITFVGLGLDHFKYPLDDPSIKQGHVLLEMADDLLLRLRTLSAATPDIARSGRILRDLLNRYKALIRQFHHIMHQFDMMLQKNAVENENLLSLMASLDSTIAQNTRHSEAELRKRIAISIRINILFFMVILPVVFIGGTIAYSIRKPVKAILKTVRRLSEGDPPQLIMTSFDGEFEQVRQDLNLLIEATNRVTHVAEEVAAGNTHLAIEARSDRDRLMLALNGMTMRLDRMVNETKKMINSVGHGDLDVRGDVAGFKGGWYDLVKGINDLIEGLKNEISTSAALEQEMALAQNIQASLLPVGIETIHKAFDIAVSMVPVDQVGGDFYDVSMDCAGHLRLAIGDVSGHGVTPGLIMMMAQTVHATVAFEQGRDSRDAVVATNRLLFNNVHERLNETHFMTFVSLRYLGDGLFEHAGAHLRIIVYRSQSRRCELIPTKGIYLNLKKDISKSVTNNYFTLNKDDIMILYTDGVTEAKNQNGDLYDVDWFIGCIEHYAGKRMEPSQMNRLLMEGVLDWCNGIKEDDMTLLIVKRKDGPNG